MGLRHKYLKHRQSLYYLIHTCWVWALAGAVGVMRVKSFVGAIMGVTWVRYWGHTKQK